MRMVLLISGGIDSSALLSQSVKFGHKIKPLAVDYGQKNSIEIESADKVCASFGLKLERIQIVGLRALMDDPVYSTLWNTETLLLTLAGSLASPTGANTICIGSRSGKVPVALNSMFGTLNPNLAYYAAPFALKTKEEVVKEAVKFGVNLGATYSCLEGDAIHCGTCAKCLERKEAFKAVEVQDPTTYKV